MNRLGLIIIILLFAISFSSKSMDNRDINVFGYLQSVYMDQEMQHKLTVFDLQNRIIVDTLSKSDRTSFLVQQFDLCLSKNITQDERFRVFIDLEFKLSYSSEWDWGSLNLQEAWLQYRFNDQFNVQFGKLFPKFNHLNEVKNKLPLMKYIFRPTVYEQTLSGVFKQEDFVPMYAFLQLSGFLPIIGDVRFEYAGYLGNSELSYISTSEDVEKGIDFISGVDTRGLDSKLIGGRLGFYKSDETFKTGVSFTYDEDNRREPVYMIDGPPLRPAMGDVPRYRIGFDLFVNDAWGFDLEAEIISVFYDYDKTRYPNVDMGQVFYYGHLSYNLWDELYAYGQFEYNQDKFIYSENRTFSFGLFYKFNDFVNVKAQYVDFEERMEAYRNHFIHQGNLEFILLGVGVLF